MGDEALSQELTKGSPWDVFIHLLAVVTLYCSAYATLTLLFQYINLALPDPLDDRVAVSDYVRYAVALLIVSFPAYCWAWHAIEVDLAANPGKRRLWVRTCPIYLTLFLAGLLILGDLVCLIYYFLGGDLASRFALKIAAILLVAGAVFSFYRNALRRAPGDFPAATRYFAYGVATLLTALAATGFVIVGAPSGARAMRFDSEKAQDLANLQSQIVSYWQRKGTLPASLDLLSDSISGYTPPTDPQSKAPYGYRVTGTASFELCADFNAKADEKVRSPEAWMIPERPGRYAATNWNHPSGHMCFARTIDEVRYPRGKPTAGPP
jgi:uncharacterized protein DUF5671